MRRGKVCRYYRDRLCTVQAKQLSLKDGRPVECDRCPKRTK